MDTFQLLVAVNKAVNARTKGSMTTKTIHSEILYSLSPSNSVMNFIMLLTTCAVGYAAENNKLDMLVSTS